MSVHKRQQIRKAVVQLLQGKTAAEDRVFSSREVPWRQVDLPAISVFTSEETAELLGGGDVLTREAKLEVFACVSASAEADDQIDSLAEEIEKAMRADFHLGLAAVVDDSVLTETVMDVVDISGRMVGAVRLTFMVKYTG